MKLIVPFTDLRPETYRATKDWPDVEYRFVGRTDTAYAELLQELWAAGETFCICEHDVIPNPGQLGELAVCHHPYCAVPVALAMYVAPCMSLTKFDARLLQELPDVMDRVMRVPTNHGVPGHYRQLDTVIQRTILLNRYGRQPHVHLPPATHLNEEKSVLVPGAALRLQVHPRPALLEPPD